MEIEKSTLDVRPIKNGWAILDKGWAVHGETTEPLRNGLKSLASSKTKAFEAYKWAKVSLFRRGMLAILALEIPPSDFLDGFSTHSGA